MITEETIDRVREAADIVDIVGEHVKLRRSGADWRGPCPFHGGKNPNFSVSPRRNAYHCFKCGVKGDVFTFVQEHEHLDFVGAVESLAAKAGVQLTYATTGQSKERARRKQLVEAMSTAVDWYHRRLLEDPAARDARDYLRSRGLAGDVARTFRLGWAPDDWDSLFWTFVRDHRDVFGRNPRSRMMTSMYDGLAPAVKAAHTKRAGTWLA